MYPYNFKENNQQNVSPVNPNMYQGAMHFQPPNQQLYNYQQMPPSNYPPPMNYQLPFQPSPLQMQVRPTPSIQPAANVIINDKQKLYKIEQQRKFKELGKNYKNTSIDSMLSNIVSVDQSKSNSNKPKVADDFGEFLQAPIESNETFAPFNKPTAAAPSTPNLMSDAEPSRNNLVPSNSSPTDFLAVKPVEPQKSGVDLQAKMMASLDLSQSKHAYRNFKPLPQHQGYKRESKTYQASAKAADWSSLSTIEGVFQKPEPVPDLLQQPAQETSRTPSPINSWLVDIDGAPLVYKHVYEACVLSDGLMDTSRLYPILLQCNLPKESLAHLWTLANQAVPGRLNQAELFSLLALIALTQNGYQNVTIEQVLKEPSAPVPFLAAYATPSEQSNIPAPLTIQSNEATSPKPLEQPRANFLNSSPVDEFGDFQDFQSVSDSGAIDSHQIVSNRSKSSFAATFEQPSPITSFTPTFQKLPSKDQQPNTELAFSLPPSDLLQAPSLFSNFPSSNANPCISSEVSTTISVPPTKMFDDASSASLFKPIDDPNPASIPDMVNTSPKPVISTTIANFFNAEQTLSAFTEVNDGKVSPVPPGGSVMAPEKNDKYSVFSNLGADDEFSFFRDSAANSSATSSATATFHGFDSSAYTSVVDHPTSTITTSNSPDLFKSVQSQDLDSSWTDFASPQKNANFFSEQQTSDNMTSFNKLTSIKGDLFKNVLSNTVNKLDVSPIASDSNSVQSLDLGLSHIISQQSIGTVETTEQSEVKHRKSSVAPKSTARKYGPSFCDDDYDIDGVDEPPPDMLPGACDEFDVFQDGTSTLVGFDAFEQPEKPQNRNLNLSFTKKTRRRSSSSSIDSISISPVPSPKPVVGSIEVDNTAFEIAKQRINASTPPLVPVRLRTDSFDSTSASSRLPSPKPVVGSIEADNTAFEIAKQRINASTPPLVPVRLRNDSFDSTSASSRQSINSPVDWNIHLAPTDNANAYVDKWEECLMACHNLIATANSLFSSIKSPEICKESVYSVKGQRFIADLNEVYGISKRICVSMRGLKVENEALQVQMKQIEMSWHNLLSFCPDIPVMNHTPSVSSDNVTHCGVCLQGLSGDTITYAATDYHSTCANFWVNCVEPLLPAIKLPDSGAGLG